MEIFKLYMGKNEVCGGNAEILAVMSYVFIGVGFPMHRDLIMVYCTSPIDIQTAAIRTHRASPLVTPTREQRN
jgi:hypothetical protein